MANLAKFTGFRLYPEQREKVIRISKKLKVSESEALRRMIEAYKV